MTRRTYLAQAAAAASGAAVFAAVGCAAPGAGGAEKPGASAPPVTIRWPEGTGPLEVEFSEAFNKAFNQKYGPKITVVTEPFPEGGWSGRYEKWTTMAVSGTMPEIITLCCTFIRPFMLKGLVMELDKYIKRDWKQQDIDDFFRGPYEAFTIRGKQLGLPVYINTNIMFVNLNHLKEAGLKYPSESWTKQEFLDYVVKLAKRTGPGRADRWGYDMGFAALDRNITWIWNNGGEPHDPKDGPVVTKLMYDDPKTIEGLQFLHDLIWKHQVSPINNEQRGGMGNQDAFLNGKIAIYFQASGNAGAISTKAPDTGLEWDFLPLVKGPKGHGARISTDGYMIDKQTKYAEQSWTVLRELVSTSTQTLRAQIRRLQPPRKSSAEVWEKVYTGKNARLGRTMAETARPDPRAFWKEADQVGKIVGNYMSATMLRNEMGVAQAMKQAMEEVRGFYASNP
ncbi:MAG: sugar ABC transporter substrate-binding protein [Chloroflexi bacterium]|nr:sugar ABC transporter substrate-binding protein [Chloroflexota bacterium]